MEPSVAEIVAAVITTGIITGAVSAFGTVAAIRVHITYLREGLERAEIRIEKLEDRAVHRARNNGRD